MGFISRYIEKKMESLYLLVAIGNVLWFSQIDLGYTGIHNFAMPQALPAIIRAVVLCATKKLLYLYKMTRRAIALKNHSI
jgi:hypothetical protein